MKTDLRTLPRKSWNLIITITITITSTFLFSGVDKADIEKLAGNFNSIVK